MAVEDLNSFYTLPLTECIFAETRKLVGLHVRLLRRTIYNVRLRRLLPIPMMRQGRICQILNERLDIGVATHDNGKVDLFSMRCDPDRDQLCLLVGDQGEHSTSVRCAQKILQGASVAEFSKFCPLQCNLADEEGRIITTMTPTHFLITQAQKAFDVTCHNKNYLFINNNSFGALEVHLPCDCTLKFESGRPITPNFPCLPVEWLKLKDLIIPPYDKQSFPMLNKWDGTIDMDKVIEKLSYEAKTPLTVVYVLITIIAIGILYILTLIHCRNIFKFCHKSERRRDKPRSHHSNRPNVQSRPLPDPVQEHLYLTPQLPQRNQNSNPHCSLNNSYDELQTQTYVALEPARGNPSHR